MIYYHLLVTFHNCLWIRNKARTWILGRTKEHFFPLRDAISRTEPYEPHSMLVCLYTPTPTPTTPSPPFFRLWCWLSIYKLSLEVGQFHPKITRPKAHIRPSTVLERVEKAYTNMWAGPSERRIWFYYRVEENQICSWRTVWLRPVAWDRLILEEWPESGVDEVSCRTVSRIEGITNVESHETSRKFP